MISPLPHSQFYCKSVPNIPLLLSPQRHDPRTHSSFIAATHHGLHVIIIFFFPLFRRERRERIGNNGCLQQLLSSLYPRHRSSPSHFFIRPFTLFVNLDPTHLLLLVHSFFPSFVPVCKGEKQANKDREHRPAEFLP